MLLWHRHRPVGIAPIRPLAWEPPYATGVALKRRKKKVREQKIATVLLEVYGNIVTRTMRTGARTKNFSTKK